MCLSDHWSFASNVLAWGNHLNNVSFSSSFSVANMFNVGGPMWFRSAQRCQADMLLSWHLLRRHNAAFAAGCSGFCDGFETLTSIWNAALWLDCFMCTCGKGLTLHMSPIWLTYKCNKSDMYSLEFEEHFVSSRVLEATLNLGLVIEWVLCDAQLFWLLKQLPCGN